MRYGVILSTIVLVGLALVPRAAQGAPAAPSAAEIVESAPIQGVPGANAVIYRQNGIRLGAVLRANGSETLIWSRKISEVPARLSSPGPSGLFQGIVRSADSPAGNVFAYLVRPAGVVSAIKGYPSGVIHGAEGAQFHGLSFTLKDPDSTHVGSVKYRYDTTDSWGTNGYSETNRIRVPDYAKSAYPAPNATITTKAGNTVLIRLEVADTEALQTTGLMNRTSLDPDSGMIFVWPSPILDSFWMENTYIPLSIAFLSSKGTVQEIQDMAPLTRTLHTPASSYQYAVEVNLGYFKAAGIAPGDTLNLDLKP